MVFTCILAPRPLNELLRVGPGSSGRTKRLTVDKLVSFFIEIVKGIAPGREDLGVSFF